MNTQSPHVPLIILGGGVIGLANAFELAKRGHNVTIIEKTECGGQATGAAAGMLAPYSEIGEDPDDFFTMCHQSLKLYPDWQADVKEVSKLDFEYNTSGSLHVVFHEADELALETRLQWQKGWDVESEIVRGEALKNLEPLLTGEALAAMYYPGEHHLYAPDYVIALKVACEALGVTIVEHAGECHFKEINDDLVVVSSENKGEFTADQCIVSNGAWTSLLGEAINISLPVFPIRGQICAYEQQTEKVNHIIFSSQGYMVEKANGSLVCGASEDIAGYDTSTTEKGIGRLEKWSKKLFPYLRERSPFHKWAGLRPATQDGYPLIGRLSEHQNIIISSGHYRNGILLSPMNAHMVADLYEGKQPSINMTLFNPNRFS